AASQHGITAGPCSNTQTNPVHCSDAFVTKLNPAGSALVYSTFLGGASARTNGLALDAGSSIAIDSDGNAYVTGRTASTDFPTTAGAFPSTYRDCSCEFPPLIAFVTKLDPTGSGLLYSAYLGLGEGSGIAVDAAGNAYVTGLAGSDFPTT